MLCNPFLSSFDLCLSHKMSSVLETLKVSTGQWWMGGKYIIFRDFFLLWKGAHSGFILYWETLKIFLHWRLRWVCSGLFFPHLLGMNEVDMFKLLVSRHNKLIQPVKIVCYIYIIYNNQNTFFYFGNYILKKTIILSFWLIIYHNNRHIVSIILINILLISRPCVAAAVLQTPLWLIDWLRESVSDSLWNCIFKTPSLLTVRARERNVFWTKSWSYLV